MLIGNDISVFGDYEARSRTDLSVIASGDPAHKMDRECSRAYQFEDLYRSKRLLVRIRDLCRIFQREPGFGKFFLVRLTRLAFLIALVSGDLVFSAVKV